MRLQECRRRRRAEPDLLCAVGGGASPTGVAAAHRVGRELACAFASSFVRGFLFVVGGTRSGSTCGVGRSRRTGRAGGDEGLMNMTLIIIVFVVSFSCS